MVEFSLWKAAGGERCVGHSILRRALNDLLQFSSWKDFGGLLVRHQNPGAGFIQLGPGNDTPMEGHARKVCQVLDARAKGMIAERNTRTRSM